MAATNASRQSDEQLLAWLDARTRGATVTEIGKACGATSQRVSTATNRVKKADLKEAGEPQKHVLKGYW